MEQAEFKFPDEVEQEAAAAPEAPAGETNAATV